MLPSVCVCTDSDTAVQPAEFMRSESESWRKHLSNSIKPVVRSSVRPSVCLSVRLFVHSSICPPESPVGLNVPLALRRS